MNERHGKLLAKHDTENALEIRRVPWKEAKALRDNALSRKALQSCVHHLKDQVWPLEAGAHHDVDIKADAVVEACVEVVWQSACDPPSDPIEKSR